MKYFKIIALVLVAVAALAYSWSVSLGLFVIIAVCEGTIALAAVVGQDTWRQTSRADRPATARPVPVRAATRPRERRKPRQAGRSGGRRSSEVLHPDATVTFSDERRAAGVEEIFAALDDQLVGLVPVKQKVRNELERARLRHAHRLASDPDLSWSRDDLMRIESADILSSPVFSLTASLSAMEASLRQ